MNDAAELSLLVFVSGVISFNTLILTVFCLGTMLEAVGFKRIEFFFANIFKSGRHFEEVTMAIL